MKKYVLIVCIVNQGFADDVMSVARDCNARGGTIINARGTARAEAEAMFNITITPEKEIIFILATEKIKSDKLHAIYQKCGLNTAGQGIAFTLPVEDVVGLMAKKNTLKNAESLEEDDEDSIKIHKES